MNNININNTNPEKFTVNQNYPNPFNPITQIKYGIPEDSYVSINIFDLKGSSIKTLLNQRKKAGYHLISWNGTSNSGSNVAAGMYIYSIQAGKFQSVKKMVLLK